MLAAEPVYVILVTSRGMRECAQIDLLSLCWGVKRV